MKKQIDPTMPIADLLSERPQLIPIFIRQRMYCVGCSMSGFDTLFDVAEIYGLNLPAFLDELKKAGSGVNEQEA